jgi:hypothetical protein
MLKEESYKNFNRDYKKRIKTELGADLESFDYVQDSESTNKIIRGAKIALPFGTDHYLSIPPTLVK